MNIVNNAVFNVMHNVDKGLGKVFGTVNKGIEIKKVPDKLKNELSELGVNVDGKNARRTVLAAMNQNMQQNIDGIASAGIKIATAGGPEPDLPGFAIDCAECAADYGLIQNTGLAKTADASKNLLSFRPESLSADAQKAISKYMKNPINVVNAYRNQVQR